MAAHLGLFEAVLASIDTSNCSGAAKLAAIRRHLGDTPFEYLGDSDADVPVWAEAAACHFVGPKRGSNAERTGTVFPQSGNRARAALRAIRPQQWSKNLLLFVPAVLAHQHTGWPALVLAWAAFSLCASAVYVMNDLFDIESDRRHPRKRARPFAGGALTVEFGGLLAAALFFIAFNLASHLPWAFAGWLALYFTMTCAYSAWLKRKLVIDVITLASLYTVRLLAGASVVGVEVSTWLLAFGIFFFLSLAFVKRFTELLPLTDLPDEWLPGRGYIGADVGIIRVLGPVSGYLAVLVLALYIDSGKVRSLYPEPARLWLECPALLYWITRLWFFAQRRALHDDPVVFALTDPESWLVAAWMAGVAVWAAHG